MPDVCCHHSQTVCGHQWSSWWEIAERTTVWQHGENPEHRLVVNDTAFAASHRCRCGRSDLVGDWYDTVTERCLSAQRKETTDA